MHVANASVYCRRVVLALPVDSYSGFVCVQLLFETCEVVGTPASADADGQHCAHLVKHVYMQGHSTMCRAARARQRALSEVALRCQCKTLAARELQVKGSLRWS